jgi:hypothetical protein
MLKHLLTFLGLNSWNVDFKLVKKTPACPDIENKTQNLKTINALKLVEDVTPSPHFQKIKLSAFKKINNLDKFIYWFYTFYSFIVFCIMSAQPVYACIMYINNSSNMKYLTSFLIHLNIPIIYVWGKFYFKTDHYDKLITCKKFKTITIVSTALLSMGVNFADVSSFYNDYYWLSIFKDMNFFFVFIVIEWFYSRLLVYLFVFSFLHIMNNHIGKFRDLREKIEIDEVDFEKNACLSPLIVLITKIRQEIETTIGFFNNIISITTVLGGIGLAIFVRDLLPSSNDIRLNNLNFEDHDRYLLHPCILYIIVNASLLINMSRYAFNRDSFLRYIKSVNFINKFLIRMSVSKVMKKSNNNINTLTLNVTEESAITLDWIVLGNILSDKWLDFSIFGITTSDGNLIKKSLTFASTVLFCISFFRE